MSSLFVGHIGPVHMIPGQLIASGQLNDPGVNFASVHGLTPVTVRTSCPGTTSRGGLPIVQHLVTSLAEVTFLHVYRTQKLPQVKSSQFIFYSSTTNTLFTGMLFTKLG